MNMENAESQSAPRYVVIRHRFDSETNHYRWMPEVTFDNKRKWKKYLKKKSADLELRKNSGLTQQKEELSGYIINPKEKSRANILIIKIIKIFGKKQYLPGYESGYAEYEEYKAEIEAKSQILNQLDLHTDVFGLQELMNSIEATLAA